MQEAPGLPSPLVIDDLAQLDDDALLAIFSDAGTDLAVLALAGSSIELVNRILARLPEKQSRRLRYDLDHLGPTRLSDVERAQQEIARIATVGDIDANVAKVTDGERRIPIRVRLPEEYRADLPAMRAMLRRLEKTLIRFV